MSICPFYYNYNREFELLTTYCCIPLMTSNNIYPIFAYRSETIQDPRYIGYREGLKIINRLVNWGHEKRNWRPIDTIVIHTSYNALGGNPYDVNEIIKEYRMYGVSPHYLIARNGDIYRLVEDKNIAFHAGVSKIPDGRTDVNRFSIGIELVNTKTGRITDDQYYVLNLLIARLKGMYRIKYILGHNQIAPGRKDDPWNFDWRKIWVRSH